MITASTFCSAESATKVTNLTWEQTQEVHSLWSGIWWRLPVTFHSWRPFPGSTMSGTAPRNLSVHFEQPSKTKEKVELQKFLTKFEKTRHKIPKQNELSRWNSRRIQNSGLRAHTLCFTFMCSAILWRSLFPTRSSELPVPIAASSNLWTWNTCLQFYPVLIFGVFFVLVLVALNNLV